MKEQHHLPKKEIWILSPKDPSLKTNHHKINLTQTELILITKIHQNQERVTSKEDLIKSIGRDPETYTGIEMCLSRLQKKFRKFNTEEHLFRSVRNRGYCLVQIIISADVLFTHQLHHY